MLLRHEHVVDHVVVAAAARQAGGVPRVDRRHLGGGHRDDAQLDPAVDPYADAAVLGHEAPRHHHLGVQARVLPNAQRPLTT